MESRVWNPETDTLTQSYNPPVLSNPPYPIVLLLTPDPGRNSAITGADVANRTGLVGRIRSATRLKCLSSLLVAARIGRDTALLCQTLQHMQETHLHPALQHSHTQSETMYTQQVDWQVQLQHHATWNLLLQAGGPYVEGVPYLLVEFFFFSSLPSQRRQP